ncbi:hypothetical protein DY000_02008493 [Brassica cretica]|uniref:Pex N-terminal domain-containing protein n=1 Tax=Brassica cretica TaxID=69181 RepID=A0ABQ7CKX0_BRACR|nr:hypothetical protein DY000_02008493 [Brassica cretica]
MKFLETFGYIWSSRESDLIGATQRGRSRLHHPERHDLERHSEVARASITRSDVTGATQRGRSRLHHPEQRDRSDTARSLAKSDASQQPLQVTPEAWSDLPERLLEVASRLLFARIHFYSRAFWSFHYARFYF